MRSAFEVVVDRRMPDIMRRARREAIGRARSGGRDPDREGVSVIKDYGPDWIDQAVWDQLVDGVIHFNLDLRLTIFICYCYVYNVFFVRTRCGPRRHGKRSRLLVRGTGVARPTV